MLVGSEDKIMSTRNGDKAHAHIRRKARILRRIRMREMLEAPRDKAPKAALAPAKA